MTYKLSVRAKDDLRKIAVFTLEKWGVDQVGRYLDEMDRTFELLASHPGLGRSAEVSGLACDGLSVPVIQFSSSWRPRES